MPAPGTNLTTGGVCSLVATGDPSGDHLFWSGDAETLAGDIEEFVTGHRESSSTDLERVLATVLFTDIADSTRSAAEMGDQTWRRLPVP